MVSVQTAQLGLAQKEIWQKAPRKLCLAHSQCFMSRATKEEQKKSPKKISLAVLDLMNALFTSMHVELIVTSSSLQTSNAMKKSHRIIGASEERLFYVIHSKGDTLCVPLFGVFRCLEEPFVLCVRPDNQINVPQSRLDQRALEEPRGIGIMGEVAKNETHGEQAI